MKIFKYLLKPVKIILYLSIFTAIIYYRSLIFQPEVNNYIAMPLSYIEEELNIEIPAHVRTENNNEIATHSIDQGASDSVLINDKAAEQYAVINSAPISDNTSYLNSESQELSHDDQVITEKIDAVIIDNISESTDAIEIDKTPEIFGQLSDAIDQINHKIDMLFEKENNKSVTALENKKPDIEIINTEEAKEKTTTEEPIITDISGSDNNKILSMARNSFWTGNTSLSEKLYLDLSQHEDTDPDVFGELGNVYYAQGKWKQAGEAYYEAAIRLLALNQPQQVNYLLRIIQGLDAKSADKLRLKISG